MKNLVRNLKYIQIVIVIKENNEKILSLIIECIIITSAEDNKSKLIVKDSKQQINANMRI
jgi:hypothetical protein